MNPTKFIIKVKLLYKAIKIIKRSSPTLYFSLIFLVLSCSILPIISIKISSSIIDSVASDNVNQTDVIIYLLLWGIALLLYEISNPIINFLQSNLADKAVYQVNSSIISKSNSLKTLNHYESENFHNDIQIIMSQSYNKPINLVISVIGLLKDFCIISYCLALLYIKVNILGIFILFFIILHTRISTYIQSQLWSESLGRSLKSRMLNYLSSLSINPAFSKEIKLYNMGEYILSSYKKIFENLYSRMFNIRLKQILYPVLPSLLLISINVFTLYYSISKINVNYFSAGIVALLIQILAHLNNSVLSFGEKAGWMNGHLLFFEKYFSFLELSERVDNNKMIKNNKIIKISDIKEIENISFCDVYFDYPDGTEALKEINFSINKDDKIAIVGANGSGKSTIIKLLCGFYHPKAGVIKINNKDLNEYDIDNFRELISPVFQEFGNYALTIEKNISMGQDINEEYLEKIIIKANAEFIFSLKHKSKQQMGKIFGGSELSLGQWQKIAIARAFYKNALLYILDEPTSSLDPISESEVYNQFATMSENKTTIFISHRLTSVRMANKILLLDQGKQVAFDSHKNLLKQSHLYKQMFDSQANAFIELINDK